MTRLGTTRHATSPTAHDPTDERSATRPSRVVFVGSTGQMSGAEKVLLDLVRLAVGDGHRVIVACPDGPLTEALPGGVEHLSLPSLNLTGEHGPARALAIARMLARWSRARRRLATVVREPGTATVVNSLFALPAVRGARPVRGATWLVHDTVTSTKQRVVARFAAPAIRRAVAVSDATAAPLRTAGLPVTVAHNGVRWPVPELTTTRNDPPVVGMLALLTPWKGHRVLLDAVATLPGVRVELAGGSFPGDRSYVEELRRRAAAPDLAGRVTFLGHVDPSTALRRWDAAVSASITPEAGPLSVLEAMSYGVPVVGTDHGGTSEFLADDAGVLVTPGDATALAAGIRGLLADDDVRHRIARTGRRRVAEEHDLTRTLPHMLDDLLS